MFCPTMASPALNSVLENCFPGELNRVEPAIGIEGSVSSQSIIIPEVNIVIPEAIDSDTVPGVYDFDILKSIVYGGLIESIASLAVVSSAAGAGTSTFTLALSLAYLIGGLFILFHCLRELKNDQCV